MTTRMSLQEFKRLNPAKKSKFNAVRCEVDGHKFDSKAEAAFYEEHKGLIVPRDRIGLHYIEVHPVYTLPGGIRYKADFALHGKCSCYGGDCGGARWVDVIDIKGVITERFRVIRKLFDQFHPLAPLRVYRETRRGWQVVP